MNMSGWLRAVALSHRISLTNWVGPRASLDVIGENRNFVPVGSCIPLVQSIPNRRIVDIFDVRVS
jgi:hypothetical protein